MILISAQFFEAYVTFRLILGTSLICIHLINYIWTLELFSNYSRPFANAAYDFARYKKRFLHHIHIENLHIIKLVECRDLAVDT